ncbi:hypothetical protein EYR36_010703 [Pleurotus pulmonarius]|nr:hypothetical protein EYR36_010703 [Pleurotus pulmonarius]
MTKSPVIDGVDNFISALTDELKLYCGYYYTGMPEPSLDDILEEVRQLIEWKRTQSSIPSRQEVHLLIQLFGQYAILSHRWEEEELSFADAANLPDSTVEAKKGFGKLTAFAKAVKTYYGCRYLWMDTVCIDDADRDRSIARMFGWYRHAYICIIYLGHTFSEQPWFSRGWTLQEFIAASRIAIFTRDSGAWYPNLRWQSSDSDSRIRDLASK